VSRPVTPYALRRVSKAFRFAARINIMTELMKSLLQGVRVVSVFRRYGAALCVVALSGGLMACVPGGPQTQGAEPTAQSTSGSNGGNGQAVTADDMDDGLREALSLATQRVVAQLGATDGFYAHDDVRIPLPARLQSVREQLARVGQEGRVDALHEQLNRAAERAAPEAEALFLDALRDMTVSDARAILSGPEDSATRYFREATGDDLEAAMAPIIEDRLDQVGAFSTWGQLQERLEALPLVSGFSLDLTDHVVHHAVDGLFLRMAEEEAAIRANPAQRGSELLERVFRR